MSFSVQARQHREPSKHEGRGLDIPETEVPVFPHDIKRLRTNVLFIRPSGLHVDKVKPNSPYRESCKSQDHEPGDHVVDPYQEGHINPLELTGRIYERVLRQGSGYASTDDHGFHSNGLRPFQKCG